MEEGNPIWNLVSQFGGWLVAVIVGAIAAFVPKKGSLENLRIDQYQEDQKNLGERLDGHLERIDRLEALLVWYQRRDVAWELREARLMIGVERGVFPPWPAREGILTEERP